jgi:hypothetical protein
MRSLIIIEVEHGEDTDALQHYFEAMVEYGNTVQFSDFEVVDSTVKVDLPECFVLDKPLPQHVVETGCNLNQRDFHPLDTVRCEDGGLREDHPA